MRKWIFAFTLSSALLSPWLRGAELPQDAYLWQRTWNPGVRFAIQSVGTNFSTLVLLHTEVTWKQEAPQIIRVPVDFSVLRNFSQPVGLALRIGPFGGTLGEYEKQVQWIANLAASIIREAVTNGVRPAELQIDFDCAESKLAGYQMWVDAVRQKVMPIPVIITALPAWLNRSSFKPLAQTSDGFVLQVHSLERPKGASEPWQLCDPQRAIAAVEKAAQLGAPFRVALPTYGYLLAFDMTDKFLGLSAETFNVNWPDDALVREVQANPVDMAALVARWTTNHPAAMNGVIWYRLPVPGDKLNWRWPTLAAVMHGRIPSSNLKCETRRSQPALVEIDLLNQGTLETKDNPIKIGLRWQQARVIAGDALASFSMSESLENEVHFISTHPHVEAGERITIGWIRFDHDTEVQIELN